MINMYLATSKTLKNTTKQNYITKEATRRGTGYNNDLVY